MKHQPRKRFGQHFLHDKQVIQKIIDVLAVKPQDVVIEIGPGLGALTQPLLKRHGKLIVVELDRDIIPRLQQACFHLGELQIHAADVLHFNFRSLIKSNETSQQKLRIVGNLPYNISTPLLFHLLGQRDVIQDMLFMLQKEVVDRLAAKPGSSDYGRLSVMIQYYCQVQCLFDVSAHAFNPPPQVTSAVVHLIPYICPPYVARNIETFGTIVRSAFNQRRKTLHNSLKTLITATQLEELGIDPRLRPEELNVRDFVIISNKID